MKYWWSVALVAAIVGGCTRKNPSFCCLTEADCAAEGVTDGTRPCGDGLACVDTSCVAPMCATTGCGPEAPVCETTTGLCTGCTVGGDCERFAGTPICDVEGEATCVQCLGNEECDAAAPICDGNACRAAMSDEECPSGALGADGICVEEANVIYLNPQGSDTGTCARGTPCQDLNYALMTATDARRDIVFTFGNYTTRGAEAMPTAASVSVHGHGATLTGGDDDYKTFYVKVPTTIVDLSLRNLSSGNSATALRADAPASLSRVSVKGTTALNANSPVSATDLNVEGTRTGIRASSSLTLNRASVRGGFNGIVVFGGSAIIENTLIAGTEGVGLFAQYATGTLRFSTIAQTGTQGLFNDPSTQAGGFGVQCDGAQLRVENSVVWTTGVTSHPPISGCGGTSNTIAGPVAVPGGMNTDPKFVSEFVGNFHIAAGSPARDAADSGPTTDFEGDPRPQGARFDIGADEAPP